MFLGFLLFNLHYAKSQLNQRYHGHWNNKTAYNSIYSIQPYLREIGIQAQDTVVSIPDGSHVSLYLMNQKGWTEYIDQSFNTGERTFYNHDSIGIQRSINSGAKYLIINGIEQLFEKKYLQDFCYHLVGQYRGVLIFDPLAADTNYYLPEKVIKQKWLCNAENRTADSAYFLEDTMRFEYGITQSATACYSGEFSCRLNSEHPYGMTIKLDSATMGESFQLSVWRKNSIKNSGHIVVSIDGRSVDADSKIINRTADGWEQIELNVFILENLAGKQVVLFLYNPLEQEVYFDDFEITWYQSVMN